MRIVVFIMLLVCACFAQGKSDNGLAFSSMATFVNIPVNGDSVTVFGDEAALYWGACYQWSDHTFISGAGVYWRPVFSINPGLSVDENWLAAVIYVFNDLPLPGDYELSNLQFGLNWNPTTGYKSFVVSVDFWNAILEATQQ